MSLNAISDSTQTSAEAATAGGGRRWWWGKLIDLEEAKHQILFSLPMIFTSVCYYLIALVSVMFAGHLGRLQLTGAALANSWSVATGLSFMVGLSGALETLCGQAFGANSYRLLGLYLQSSCMISILFCIVIAVIWVFTEPILILLHQNSEVSKTAALYMRYLLPGLFAYAIIQNILRFLQTQYVVLPLLVCSILPLALHIGIAYALINFTSLGFKGAPIAASITFWISTLMLASYVNFGKKFDQHTWIGFSQESFRHVFTNLKLALPSAAMVILEFWAFEILVLLAGMMPDSETTTSVIAMCVNTEAIAYMFSYGFSAAASTRVSNELGAGNPEKAKHAMVVTIKLSILFAGVVVLALALGHNVWAGLFSDSSSIIHKFSSMTPFLAASIFLDSLQGVLSGVIRGSGWQQLAMYGNLVTFYFIGMPIACLLGFKLKLYAKGLWIGLISGLCCQTGALCLITRIQKWNKLELPGDAAVEMQSNVVSDVA